MPVYTERMERAIPLESIPAIIPGDVVDFDAVVRQYRPRIFAFALAALRDRDAAETVAQDCFARAHRSWNQFRGEATLQTWLLQIAVNLVRDARRNRRLQFWKRASVTAIDAGSAADWLPDRDMSPEQRAAARQQVDAIWTLLPSLSEKQRTVFLLHFMEELSQQEIAEVTGISRGAVKVHLFRAVHAIRARLGRTE
jgi:RNA polymerase sigma-70 factor (ECF subfamily)